MCFLYIELVEYLVNLDGIDVNPVNIDGVSPIFIATQTENFELIEILGSHGGDVNIATLGGVTIFYIFLRRY